MKKTCINLIMVLFLLMLSGCNSINDTDAVKNGSYVMKPEETKAGILPCVTIYNEKIYFYDLTNSNSTYGAKGTYLIDDDVLTMTTDDNKNTYVFLIDGDNLAFQKNESSSANIINDRFGDTIEDNAKFYLISE